MPSLRGKNAVVTGASRGIGRAAARLLAAAGANVVVNSSGSPSGRERLEAAAREINNGSGGRAIISCGPVQDFGYAAELIDLCGTTFGSVDILLNVAGIPSSDRNSIVEVAPDEWQRLLDIHLTGTFNCCRHAAPVMVGNGAGSIVNTGSDSWTGDYAGTGYAAAKAGITGLSWAIARDLGARGVRCNVISPGARTRLARGPVFEARIQQLSERGVLPRAMADAALGMPGPEFVAPMYAYLASDASAALTGELFRVSGNSVERYPLPRPEPLLDRPVEAGPWQLAELHDLLADLPPAHAG